MRMSERMPPVGNAHMYKVVFTGEGQKRPLEGSRLIFHTSIYSDCPMRSIANFC
jgi:hypothetical protein